MHKMKLNKIQLSLLLFISIMIIMSFSSASVSTLGTFKQGSCINLIQTCGSCTYNNITSIFTPNSTVISIDSSMIQNGTTFNYIFCNTTELGEYQVNGIGDLNGVNTIWNYNFEITPNGFTLSLGQIFVYSLFLILCLALVFLSSKLISNSPPSKDPLINSKLYEMKKRNEFLYYVSVLKSKMWIAGLFGIYLSMLLFLVLSNQLVYNLGFSDLNEILKNIVIIATWGLIPFGVFWIGYTIIVFYKTTERIMRYQFGGNRE